MQLYTGTSGYSYKEWKGVFYPAELKPAEWLAHYARRLSAVEINNTFYRMPKSAVMAGWKAEVPEGFRFVIKASRRITHFSRLKEPEELLGYLWGSLAHLGPKLGAALFQLPPAMKKDAPRLEAFLAALAGTSGGALRPVLEFRHESWRDDEVLEVLRAANAALCVADTEEGEDPAIEATADWGYLRLRRPDYDEARLEGWIERVRAQAWREVFVFFKHEDAGAGPRLAERFEKMFGG